MLHKGFTLIELVMTIAILAILLVVAIPSFRALIINNRITTQANEFVSDVTYARAEAVRRNTRITVCKSADGATCDTTTATDWSEGWIVFNDPATYGVVNPPGEIVLRVRGALTSGVTLINSGTGFYYFQFLPSGIVSGVTGLGVPGTAATFTLGQSGYFGRIFNFNTTGRINITTTAAVLP